MADKRSAPRAAPVFSEMADGGDAGRFLVLALTRRGGGFPQVFQSQEKYGMSPHRRVIHTGRSIAGGKSGARLFLSLSVVAALAFLSFANPATHAQRASDDSRPRRVTNAHQQQQQQQPRPTPAPTPAPQLQTPPAAQQTPTPNPNAPVLQDPGQDVDEDDVVKVDTSLVNLNVRVIDRTNRPVNDVRQEEFKIFEDGVPQQIFSFTRAEVP
ncbi:MAG TPA: hypothetical protein VF634_14570, partial [Pyrinomonadaceae bacterium]